MMSSQRLTLINTLEHCHDLSKLARLTDPELHELWLKDCEYENPYAPLNNE